MAIGDATAIPTPVADNMDAELIVGLVDAAGALLCALLEGVGSYRASISLQKRARRRAAIRPDDGGLIQPVWN